MDIEKFKAAIRPDTLMASVIHVNNEIGVKQPLSELGEICRERKVLFHTDAAQSVGKIPINVNDSKIDMMSISGHKMYGPKGIGALYVRRKPKVRLHAQINGGGQEKGMRSGTLAPNVSTVHSRPLLCLTHNSLARCWPGTRSPRLLARNGFRPQTHLQAFRSVLESDAR